MKKTHSLMKAAKGNVKVDLFKFSKAPSAVVTLSINFPCNGYLLSCMLTNKKYPLPEGKDEKSRSGGNCEVTALAHAVFEQVRSKVFNSPENVTKYRISNIRCSVRGSMFNIYWETTGTLSCIRKAINAVCKNLSPNSLKQKYSDNLRQIGHKHGDGFAGAAHLFSAALDSSVRISIVGKISIKEESKLQEVADKAHAKLSDLKLAPKAKSDFEHGNVQILFPTISSKGHSGCLLYAYILSHPTGVSADFAGNEIIFYTRNAEKIKDQLSDRSKLEKFVSKKLTSESVSYFVALYGGSAAEVSKFGTKYDPREVASEILGALK